MTATDRIPQQRTITMHGFLPTSGEAAHAKDNAATAGNLGNVALAHLVTGPTYRKATFDYMTQVCMAADLHGADSMLVPVGTFCEDPFVSAAMMAARVPRLKMMVAFRPGQLNPVATALACTTFQRFSGGRLMLNVTPGLPGPNSHRFGDWNSKDGRLKQAGEFLTIMRGAWGDTPFDFEGEFYKVKGASVGVPDPLPKVFYGGSSDISMQFAADYADVYLSYTEPPEMVEERLARVRKMAADRGRQLSCALSFGIIAAETSDEAWRMAGEVLTGIDSEALKASAEGIWKNYSSSGARQRLVGAMPSPIDATIAPNLWIGMMLVRPGWGPVLVGSYEEVADRMTEMVEMGADEFVIMNAPGVESWFTLGEKIRPLLKARGITWG